MGEVGTGDFSGGGAGDLGAAVAGKLLLLPDGGFKRGGVVVGVAADVPVVRAGSAGRAKGDGEAVAGRGAAGAGDGDGVANGADADPVVAAGRRGVVPAGSEGVAGVAGGSALDLLAMGASRAGRCGRSTVGRSRSSGTVEAAGRVSAAGTGSVVASPRALKPGLPGGAGNGNCNSNTVFGLIFCGLAALGAGAAYCTSLCVIAITRRSIVHRRIAASVSRNSTTPNTAVNP